MAPVGFISDRAVFAIISVASDERRYIGCDDRGTRRYARIYAAARGRSLGSPGHAGTPPAEICDRFIHPAHRQSGLQPRAQSDPSSSASIGAAASSCDLKTRDNPAEVRSCRAPIPRYLYARDRSAKTVHTAPWEAGIASLRDRAF